MQNNVLKTSADDLYELVNSRKKISVEEAAKILKVPNKTVQALVDFLVEERIFGIEYKFTTPYVFISEEKEKKIELESKLGKNQITKEEFYQKASKWNIPTIKIDDLWKRHLHENINSIKEEFYIKANLRKLSKERIDNLWIKYQVQIQ